MRYGLIGTALFVLTSTIALHGQSYRVTDHWTIGGEGGWDYLVSDDSAHRLYVTHGPRVEVLDTTNGKIVGAITGLKGTHGVALNPDGKTGYISDGRGNAIVIFDRASLGVIASVPAGINPDGITFEPTTNTIWAFNGKSKNVTVLNAADNKVTATIPLSGKPEFPQADGAGDVFVNIEDKNEVVKLDARKLAVVGEWSLKGCESPSGMAIDRDRHRLFSVCDSKVMAISDYASGTLLALTPIGDGPDAAAFDPTSKLAFSSNGEGTLTIIDTAKPEFPARYTVATAKGARTMTLDLHTHRAYLAVGKYSTIPGSNTGNSHQRPTALPGTFEILVVAR